MERVALNALGSRLRVALNALGSRLRVAPNALAIPTNRRLRHAMLVHCVFFWLKPGLNQTEQADFWRGLQTLSAIATVEDFHAGKPAATPHRPVIDHSYSAALVLRFRDVAAHDAYQDDAIHVKFVADCQRYWTRVQIYDSLNG